MKAKKKPLEMIHRINKEKKRKQRKALAVAVLVIIIFISAFIINFMLDQPSISQPISTEPKAAIVDHLSLTYPNGAFIQTVTNILEQEGFGVDYYSGEEVTVEFYRNLPAHDYRFIILRVHSALVSGNKPPVVLFTSEPFDQTVHSYELLTGQITRVAFPPYNEGDPTYFGIGPDFIKHSMNGLFKNTVVVMMGCWGLTYPETAKEFIQKGAAAYIGWNEQVLASHTDQATSRLLYHLISQKKTLKQAIDDTTKDVGPAPAYNSQLIYYPLEAGDRTIQNMVGNIVATSLAEIQSVVVPEKRKVDNF